MIDDAVYGWKSFLAVLTALLLLLLIGMFGYMLRAGAGTMHFT